MPGALRIDLSGTRWAARLPYLHHCGEALGAPRRGNEAYGGHNLVNETRVVGIVTLDAAYVSVTVDCYSIRTAVVPPGSEICCIG